MINNDWQALGVGLVVTREIKKIITSSTARIDLPMWLRSEPYNVHTWSLLNNFQIDHLAMSCKLLS